MNKNKLVFTAIMLFFVSAKAAEPVVRLDSLIGTAEVQRAGKFRWVAIDEGTVLYNNDMLRVLGSSKAWLRWDSGNLVYVNENSQIRINSYKNPTRNLISRHITVFFGALYFVIEKALPRGLISNNSLKVYTPTAIVAIRGTSFTVEVGTSTGTTDVSVLDGRVLVRNIIRQTSTFLDASYRTSVSVGADPAPPTALTTADVAKMNTWIPGRYVSKALARGSEALPAKTEKALRKRVLLVPLHDESGYGGTWNVGKVLAAGVSRELTRIDKTFPVSVAEKRTHDPLALGMRKRSRYVVTGRIMEFDISKRAEINTKATRYSEYALGRVLLELNVIDIEEKKVRFQEVFAGEAADTNATLNSWSHVGAMELDLADKRFIQTVLGKACRMAVERAAKGLIGYLEFADLPVTPERKSGEEK